MKKTSVILALVLALGCFAGCQSENSAAPELLEPVGVRMDTAEVQYGDIYTIKVFGGSVVPYVEDLDFQVDGYLGEVLVNIGDTVEAGQPLVRLDYEDLQEQIDTLAAQIAYDEQIGQWNDRQAEIKVEIAKLELAELEEDPLTENKTIKAKLLEIEQLEIDRRQAQELRQIQLDQQKAGLAALQEELVGVEVTAPFSGTVVYITQAGIGDKIASFSPVASIVDNSRLTIISEPMSNSVLEGADQIYAEILGQRYDITHIPMEQEEYLQRLLAGDDLYNEFAVNNPSDALESGQYAAVTIIDNYRENVLVVPVNSLYRDEKGHYVYRVIDGARVRQDITVGITTDIEVEVLEGLEEGDVIYVKE